MIKIVWANSDITFDYAAKELKKYLDKVTDDVGFAKLCKVDALPEKIEQGSIQLGLLSDFDLDSTGVEDSLFDDLEDVSVENGTGYFAGSNARSVLFGIYDYFKSAGCAWVRPGIEGEIIKKFNPMEHKFIYRKLADTRYRGEMLEGAVKYEHARAVVEWSPKVHMNLFQIQGIVPFNFMSRWYDHPDNPYLESEDIGYDGLKQLIECLEKDVRRVGLQLWDLGHFYQTEVYGFRYEGSDKFYPIPESMKDEIALVGGQRKFRGSPSWTQLCMGKPGVLEKQVKWLADYTESKPEITVLAVWMADGVNNHCECDLCKDTHPCDMYVRMLNMLDAEFTKRGLDTKIYMDAYTDCLWAPPTERFNNPDRFILAMSICGRNYYEPYDTAEYDGKLPIWERNNFNVEPNFRLYRKFFKEWKKVFSGDVFACDFHYYRIQFSDFGGMKLSKCYYEDLHTIDKIDAENGLINCQTQRAAFPIALPSSLTGEALFDLKVSYEDLEKFYFDSAYGEYADLVKDYLNEVSTLCHPDIISGRFDINNMKVNDGLWYNNPVLAADLEKIPAVVDTFLEKIKDVNFEDKTLKRSFRILSFHGEYVKKMCDVFIPAAKGNFDEARAKLDVVMDFLWKHEYEFQYELDARLFKDYYTNVLKEENIK